MALKIAPKKVTAAVTKEVKDKKEVISSDVQEEQVDSPFPVDPQPKPMCEVGFEASYTHNLGNYQSARVQVTLKIPCAHEQIDEAFDYAKEWVDARMSTLQEELEA